MPKSIARPSMHPTPPCERCGGDNAAPYGLRKATRRWLHVECWEAERDDKPRLSVFEQIISGGADSR